MSKRFIAGAVCPKCSKMDKIVMYKEDGHDWRACVSCGYQDKMNFQAQVRELDTRVNVTEEEKQDQLQVIQIEPLGKKH
ncbi:YheV family putative zinc ribbon protein [Pseudoteredinibacter isoporae]|uniref:YheV family putative zinc ribbon protein n=1 Tax=Pseudoteredinibacter isoporae TaxID=570281 RepID=UPI0031087688